MINPVMSGVTKISDATDRPSSSIRNLTLKERVNAVIPSERRSFVRVRVDEMTNFEPNPRLQHASAVARRVVATYPDTFEDRTDDSECLGNGYYSLAQKIKTRIEHVNRGNGMVKIRKNRKRPHDDSNSDDDMMPQHRRPSDVCLYCLAATGSA